jgi:hypothetical protein
MSAICAAAQGPQAMKVNAKILERAARLKALTTSNNEHEAANALAALQRLADKYRFEVASIQDLGAEPDVLCDKCPVFRCGRPPAWKVDLLLVLAEMNGCCEYHVTSGKSRAYMLAGKPEDIANVRFLWAQTVVVLTRLAAARFPSGRGRGPWLLGAVQGIEYQLRAARKAMRAKVETKALAVMDQRLGKAQEAIDMLAGAPARLEPPPRVCDVRRYQEGLDVGKHLNLGLRKGLRGGARRKGS